ncbi:MAG: T9SS type A sorting domain-containing protein [Bacteroidales bacterium]|nr:T9SS type A sorting domain-containing protein [Bacteroidales bacterium]
MKKLVLFFGLICMINLTFAQETVTIHQNGHDFQVSAVRSVTDYPAENIQYWVGTGSNSIVAVFKWCQNATMGIAYGFRWDGSATIYDMLTGIAAADSRFTVTFSGTMINTYSYQDGTYNEYLDTPGYLMYTLNGNYSSGYSDPLVNNGYFEMEEWGDCYPFPSTTPIVPATDPNASTPEEATIDFADILFWVGEGTNEAVLAVNWADTALAWGYRWNGDATVSDMMAHIAAADPRFSYTGSGYLDDIHYIDTATGMTTPLGITPGNWWGSSNNGFMDMGLAQYLNNGDLEKWADPAAGVLVDSTYDATYGYWWYTYVYPMTITPVTVPDTTNPGPGPGPDPDHGPFCGGVGTEGCNAIAANDNQIVAWATNVVVTRGPQNISNPNSPLASHGTDADAVGPATMNNSMEVVSLGDGGSALITFERPIRNGEGPDFAVFENDNIGNFLELAFVEVSSDGEHFVRFPATSLTPTETQTGSFALTDPTFINNLAGKFRIGYGTPFDLAELADSANIDLDNIVYVRVIDVVGCINPQYATYDAFGHIVNDPWPTDFASSGFDLAGVGVIHQKPLGIDNHEMPQVFAYPNPCTGTLYIINENAERIELYNLNGQLLEMVNNGDTHVNLNMQAYPAGLYLLKVGNGVQKILKK